MNSNSFFLVSLLLALIVALCAWASAAILQITGPKKKNRFYEMINRLYNISSSNELSYGMTPVAILYRFAMEFLLYRAVFAILADDLHWADCWNPYLLYGVIALIRIVYIVSMQLIFLDRKRFTGRS